MSTSTGNFGAFFYFRVIQALFSLPIGWRSFRVSRGVSLKPEQINYLSNRLGECIPERIGKDYIEWWTQLDGYEFSYLVEVATPTGYQIGALFLEEFAHADSPDKDDKTWATENRIGNSSQVFETLKTLAQKLQEKGFITGAFEKTGPFERHELVGFVPYPQKTPDKSDWLKIIENTQ